MTRADVKLTANERFVLAALRDRNDGGPVDAWERDRKGRRWPSKQLDAHKRGVLEHGRDRTLWALRRKGLVSWRPAPNYGYEINALGLSTLEELSRHFEARVDAEYMDIATRSAREVYGLDDEGT